MSKKTCCLYLALCACLSAPLASYAAGDEGTDRGGTRESIGESISDAAITTKVKAAILGDSTLKVMQIKVETNDGVVQLSGTVDTPEAAAHAAEVAQQVKGVKSVANDLVVGAKSDTGSSDMDKGSNSGKSAY